VSEVHEREKAHKNENGKKACYQRLDERALRADEDKPQEHQRDARYEDDPDNLHDGSRLGGHPQSAHFNGVAQEVELGSILDIRFVVTEERLEHLIQIRSRLLAHLYLVAFPSEIQSEGV
jgi:hypothetical protein